MNMSENVAQIPFTVIGPRLRKSPFFEATRRYGCKAYSVYNHMYMPLFYSDPVTDYQNLMENVCLWDVACERQVEITGPDAFRFSQYLTTRDISQCEIGQCMYAPLVDENGGLLNDPVMLRLGESHFWFSLADSDILLWAKGLAFKSEFDVEVSEPYVSPLAIQGPKATEVVRDLFGDWVRELRFFYCREEKLGDIPLVIAKSGWSKQGGFELYLQDSRYGNELWERVMEAGKPYQITAGAPSAIERIESGLLSYGSDMDMTNNPYEVGLEKYVALDQENDFIGKQALKGIVEKGISQKLVGIEFDDDRLAGNENRWPVFQDGIQCGTVRSATYSPRLEKNIALTMVAIEQTEIGTPLSVQTPLAIVDARVVSVPFV